MKLSSFISATLSLIACVDAIWPIPTGNYTHGMDTIWLSSNVKLEYGNYRNGKQPNQRVLDAWGRTKKALFEQNIVPWKFHARHSKFEPSKSEGTKISKIVIRQTKADNPNADYTNLMEGYSLEIPTKTIGKKMAGTIYIEAESSLGILHAFSTLQQIFYATKSMKGDVYGRGPVSIMDKPKFPHRGVNLDVARQWYPKSTILRVIDAMSWNKFNHLHLHATDSQSWPLEIPALPELAKKGSYADGLTYTPKDIQEILSYAEARGIKVIVEIDMPGHTTAIAEAFPDLIVGKNMQPSWDKYAAQPPSGSLKLNNKDVNMFLKKLFNDLLPRLRNHCNIFHIGGDEVNSNVYALPGGLGSSEKKVIQPALNKFVTYVQGLVKNWKMSTIVWEEMLLDWNLKINKNTIVQTWRSDVSAKNATSQGFRVIGGTYESWYLDCGHGQWLNFGGKAAQNFYPYNDWCAPLKNWRLIYSYSPDQHLSTKEAKLVLGGEVHVWSEQIDSSSIDIIMWPRASAAAEVLWSGRTDAAGRNRTFADASERLGEMRERMVSMGVGAQPVMQLWCHQNPGDCELNG